MTGRIFFIFLNLFILFNPPHPLLPVFNWITAGYTWLFLIILISECAHTWLSASAHSVLPKAFPLSYFLYFYVFCLPGMSASCQWSVAAGTRLSWRPISSKTCARRLRLPSGKCWASHKSRITPVGLDLVAK